MYPTNIIKVKQTTLDNQFFLGDLTRMVISPGYGIFNSVIVIANFEVSGLQCKLENKKLAITVNIKVSVWQINSLSIIFQSTLLQHAES